MNKRKLSLFLAVSSSLIPTAVLSLSASVNAYKFPQYFDFPNNKYAASIHYEKKTISFSNLFMVPSDAKSQAGTKFFMRTWEPKNWKDISKPNEKLENGKWKVIDLSSQGDYPYDHGCENPYDEPGVCAPTFYTTASGFEKTTEYSNLSDLLSSIYWKNLTTDDENINKNPFINTFKHFVTKNLNKQFNDYANLEKYIKKITMYQKAKNMIATHHYTAEDQRDEYEFPTDGEIEYTKKGNWDHITDYTITVDLEIPKEIAHPFSAYKTDFNTLKNKLTNEDWTLESDTGGKFNSDEIKKADFETNETKLDKKFQEFNKKNNTSNLRAEFEIISADTINIYLVNADRSFKELVAKNIKISFKNSDKYKGYVATASLEDRLKIKLGKWVDFNSNTTQLVDDILVRADKDKEITTHGKNRYGGKWIAHTPLKVSFTTKDDEKEIIEINGQKIDVLNYYFEHDLVDNRKDANDESKEFNENFNGDKEKSIKTEDNSHAKNEYKIKITKFSDKSNKIVEYTYEKVIIIDSKSSQLNFKWYAWNPEKYKHQKELIEEFLMNEKGEAKADEHGNPLPNPKYDPLIDPKTGTKKQLVWFDFNKMKFEWSSFFTSNKEKTYYKTTKLPAFTKTLFPPHTNEKDLDRGVIMEAAVLEKGALRTLVGKTKNAHLYKLNDKNEWIESKYKNWAYELSNETSENTYFSEEGIWLFASNADKSISNFKLILIRPNNSPHTQFLDNLPNLKYIRPLWETKQGKKFFEWLEINKELKFNQIKKLNYEDAMEFYKQYINTLWIGHEYNHPIAITPKFKTIPPQKDIKDIASVKAFEPFVDRFMYDDKVALSKVEVGEGNYLKVYFKLITTNSRFRLSQNPYAVLVPIAEYTNPSSPGDSSHGGNNGHGNGDSHSGGNGNNPGGSGSGSNPGGGSNSDGKDPNKDPNINKELINLKLNSQLFLNLAAKNTYKSFLKALKTIDNKDVFIGLSDKYLKLLNIEYSAIEILNRLKIEVSFKNKSDESRYKIVPNNIFFLTLDFSKNINYDPNSNNKKPNKPIDDERDWDKINPYNPSSPGDSSHGGNNGHGNGDSHSGGNGNNPGGSGSGSNPGGGSNSDGTNRYNDDDDESDLTKEKRNIFSGIKFKQINLKGTTTLEAAKEEIKKQVQAQTLGLRINEDYIITNLDQVAFDRLNPQTNIENESDLSISIANLQALNNKFGYAQVEVINVVNQVLDEDIDLSKIKLNDISLNESKLSSLKTKVIDEINKQLKEHNLEINKDLIIDNWESGIRALSLGKGVSAKLEIKGNNIKIKNSTFVNVTNNANEVINDELDPYVSPYRPWDGYINNGHGNGDSHSDGNGNNPGGSGSGENNGNGHNNDNGNSNGSNGNNNNGSGSNKDPKINKVLYDLSYVYLAKQSFNEHVLSELREKVLKTIINNLSLQYFIEYKKHYDIDLNELNEVIKKIGKKSNEPIFASLSLKAIPNVSKNTVAISISNINKLFDPIDDLNKPINGTTKKLTQKQILLIFIPLGILGATGIGTLIGFIYVRKVKNKIK
ncbi:Hypothetical protein MAU_2820 [Metamycoplasma auris 15026]|uniref:ICEF-IIA n=1 Tax=Metamycoplasma auris 15026 TaxID=1188233 RepID=N9V058_9BACT|nr:hypothetical protein [Metamycoplasma auris]ENY68797.1 Hypothetical protein MAU_2820 [Metamycoplasma auris 15026]